MSASARDGGRGAVEVDSTMWTMDRLNALFLRGWREPPRKIAADMGIPAREVRDMMRKMGIGGRGRGKAGVS